MKDYKFKINGHDYAASVEEQDKYSDIDSFREFLRSSVYATPIPDNLSPER